MSTNLPLGLVVVCALAGATASSLAATDPRAQALIDQAKAASGGPAWDSIGFVHETGRLTASGLTGSYENWLDLRHPRSAGIYNLGPDSGGQGWDGKQVWTMDASKQVRVEASAESVASALQDLYVATNGLFFPDREPAEITAEAERQADGVTYQVIKVTPKGAEPIEYWFDPRTHLPAREVQLTGAQPATFLVGDWRTTPAGVMAPARIIRRVGDNPKFDMVTETAAVDYPATVPDARFAPPPPPADDTIWPAGRDRVSVPFELFNNHIYLLASINGAKPIRFIFDTGATNILDPQAAGAMGIKVEGSLPGSGFGDQISEVGLCKVKSVSIGGLGLPDQTFATIAQPVFNRVEDVHSSGLLGYEFAKRAVLTIDYADRTMTFVKPSAFKPPAGVAAIPFTFSEHTPMVEASVDGVSGEFEIDTGARSALTLMHPFVEANGLIGKYHAERRATVGYGVGGPSRALLGRPERLEIGPVTLDHPVADLVDDARGAAASARTAGNIGGDILKRFTVTLDYGHQTIWLQPNALARQPDLFDRSGLWLMRAKTGGAIEVGDVTADSPASKAGIAVGDDIVTVDGKAASAIRIPELRERLKGAVGQKVTLGLNGPAGKRTVTLELADLV